MKGICTTNRIKFVDPFQMKNCHKICFYRMPVFLTLDCYFVFVLLPLLLQYYLFVSSFRSFVFLLLLLFFIHSYKQSMNIMKVSEREYFRTFIILFLYRHIWHRGQTKKEKKRGKQF